jgi:hypothetical protein
MLEDDAIDALVRQRLLANEKYLAKVFTEFESWPADAQLAVSSMSWAMGPGVFPHPFSNFTTSAKGNDWAACSKECAINAKGNAGVIPRNKANVALFLAAEDTKSQERDVTKIYADWLTAANT